MHLFFLNFIGFLMYFWTSFIVDFEKMCYYSYSQLACQFFFDILILLNHQIWIYHSAPKYLDRQAWTDSVDADQTALDWVVIRVCTVYHSSCASGGRNLRIITAMILGVLIFSSFTVIYHLILCKFFLPIEHVYCENLTFYTILCQCFVTVRSVNGKLL